MEQVYYNPVRDDATGAVYCKIVNASEKEKQLTICDETGKPYQVERVWLLGGMEKEAFNSLEKPDRGGNPGDGTESRGRKRGNNPRKEHICSVTADSAGA